MTNLVCLDSPPQKAIIQLRPNWKIYMVEGKKDLSTLVDNWVISSSATAVFDFNSGEGAGKSTADLKLWPLVVELSYR